jgi:hypothetical protein
MVYKIKGSRGGLPFVENQCASARSGFVVSQVPKSEGPGAPRLYRNHEVAVLDGCGGAGFQFGQTLSQQSLQLDQCG